MNPPRTIYFQPKRLTIAALAILIGALALYLWLRNRPPKPFAGVATVAGAGLKIKNGALPDVFGVAVDDDDRVFLSDGTANSIYRINEDGSLKTVTSELDMPSAIAFAPDGSEDGSLIVANPGAHTIVRVDPETGRVAPVAGAPGVSGDADGKANEARFNGPIGVAVAKDGRIFVADSYNDRIREINKDGTVRTLATQFDTPCGIAIDADGALLVADTGNGRICRVAADGGVTTLAGTETFTFEEPMAIAVRRDGAIFIADAGSSTVYFLNRNRDANNTTPPTLTRLAGGFPNGLLDDDLAKAKLHRPIALAFNSDDALLFADNGNGSIRAFVPQGLKLGFRSKPEAAIITAEEIRTAVPPRWPFDPPQARRDVAGTFGEIRGEVLPDHDAWFHNGFDIPGAYGETARAIFSERVTRPLAVEGAGTPRERLRLPLLGYIHIRLGRDRNDLPLGEIPNGAIAFRRDEQNQIVDVRVRRGTRFNAGDALGTLNRLNHVHLIAGPEGSEVNALAALRFPGLVDTVAPTIEAVTIANDRNETLFDSAKPVKGARTQVSGKLRIVVRAFDRVDGNPGYRRLGAYRLGYQLFNAGGAAMTEPQYNLVFDRLPLDPRAVAIAYAEGSQSGYEGATIFGYIATNLFRNGEAREGFLDASQLAPGDYALRVFVDDYFGNRAHRDVPITVVRE
jgi:DNA-binding beta-propeller fold protein YncE